ncbi:hypothetical protein [Kordiimonas aquimaris]|uniref:hypothetical protein n=1 Tax=Kordiimonas aquimaris TaxID=707591 RepID=UPI0021D3A774|nr:hypothetical protein [Kordiimonas aquimaris]
MNIFLTLMKREVLENQNGYIRVPVILAGITISLVILAMLGVGELNFVNSMDHHEVENFGDALSLAQQEEGDELPAAVTVGYWALSMITWMAFPFVVFFSLLGSLYEERRDRSILFWKSMPVDDWQEVLAKLLAPVFIAPATFLAVTIAAQLTIALIISVVTLFQGGPVLELWPVGLMIVGWFTAFMHYLILAVWALPLFAWLLFVSSFANRMPFLWALLTPAVLIAIEAMFFETTELVRWIAIHMGGWQEFAFDGFGRDVDIDGPQELFRMMTSGWQGEALSYTLTSGSFWFGTIIAVGFFFGATEMRKRAT